jgi:hypothetical protein
MLLLQYLACSQQGPKITITVVGLWFEKREGAEIHDYKNTASQTYIRKPFMQNL